MKIFTISVFVAAVAASDDGLSLLQHHTIRGNSSFSQNPEQNAGERERQMCPHEIEELKEKKKKEGDPFGCRGKLFAPSTKECSWWGEPHVSATFPSNEQRFQGPTGFDVIHTTGHFRMAMAKDKSWEIQVFNCGRFSSAFAARFGTDIIEFVTISGKGVERYVNGKLQTGDFPVELPSGVYMTDKHNEVKSNQFGGNRHLMTGACADDGNSGQVYFEVGSGPEGNLNVMIKAADGSFTTEDEDPGAFCNKDLHPVQNGRRQMRGKKEWGLVGWDLPDITPEENIFTIGGKMCSMCSKRDWVVERSSIHLDHDSCSLPAVDTGFLQVRGTCQGRGIALDDAKNACAHLKDNEEFFWDCQLDFCSTGGNAGAVDDAEAELAEEHPAPVCVREGGDCDPVKVCCDAKKDKKTLNFGNVGTNNLCGNGDGKQELRFTSVIDGVDLVVKPTGDFKCTQGVTDAKNGVSGNFGVITLPVGTATEFEFTYVDTGTDSPKDVGAQPFSFHDIDQGKKGKQRSSVEVCGGSNAILTTNTELEQSISGDCIKVTSTTRGTGADNPVDPDNMSDIQRARTVAFTPSGSTFKATLGIGAKGHQSRKFMFSGGPTIACDALAE